MSATLANGGCSGSSAAVSELDGSRDVPPGSDAGGFDGSTASTPCQSDKDCRDQGALCDMTRTICVACLVDTDCKSNETCGDGKCNSFTPCDTSRECHVDQVCDRTAHRCVDCVGDNDCCPDQTTCDQVCVTNVCRRSCTSDKACTPDGLVCDTIGGHCVECLVSSDCLAGRYCMDRSCKEMVCSPNQLACTRGAVVRCSELGDGFGVPVPCPSDHPCVQADGSASCGEASGGAGGDAGDGGLDSGQGGGAGAGGLGDSGSCVGGSDADAPCQCMVCASHLCGSGIRATSFAEWQAWNFNGGAFFDATAGTAVLTDTRGYQATTIIYRNPIITDTFDVTFDFKITPNASSALRGDGMGFMIEKDGNAIVGATGGGLGMAGLNGFGVELDLFNNARPTTNLEGCGDTDRNHVSVDSLVACVDWNSNRVPTTLAKSPDLASFSIDLADGVFRPVVIQVVNGSVTVSVGGFTAVTNAILPNFHPGDLYYFGFSGGTGDFANRQEIRNVSIQFPGSRCL